MKTGSEKVFRSVLTAGALALISSMAFAADPVKIGVLFPVKNIIGKQGERGAELAADMLNKKGGVVDGRPVKLIVYDTNYQPVEGVAAAQRLLTQDEVKFVVGEVSSTVALAVIPVVQSEGALAMFAIPKHPDVTKSGYQNVFRLNSTTAIDAASFDKHLRDDLAPRKVAVLAENNDLGQLSVQNMKKLFGDRLVFSDFFAVQQSDFSALASNVRASNADLVCIVASNPEQSGNLLRAMSDLGYAPKRCLMPGLLNNDVPKVAGNAAEGVFSEDVYAPTLDNPLNKEFVAAYQQKYGAVPGKIEALGFESVWVVGNAIKAAGTDTDIDKISQTLRARKWRTPRGELRFDASGQALSDDIYRVEVKDGKLTLTAK
jgi:branched-chain amino acid transport system substrate-binding protein